MVVQWGFSLEESMFPDACYIMDQSEEKPFMILKQNYVNLTSNGPTLCYTASRMRHLELWNCQICDIVLIKNPISLSLKQIYKCSLMYQSIPAFSMLLQNCHLWKQIFNAGHVCVFCHLQGLNGEGVNAPGLGSGGRQIPGLWAVVKCQVSLPLSPQI